MTNKVYALKWCHEGEEGLCNLPSGIHMEFTEAKEEYTKNKSVIEKALFYFSDNFPKVKYTVVTYVEQK
jgi:hypothetical protein